jgi:hypothetical protein
MAFLEIVSGIGSTASILGFSIKDIISSVKSSDKKVFEEYFTFLESRQVLVAPFDKEVDGAVVASLESIKIETEKYRIKLKSELAQHFMLDLIHTLSRELMMLHKFQSSSDNHMFYKTLQIVRVKFARILCYLCASYKIDLSIKQTALSKMVLEHAYRPR